MPDNEDNKKRRPLKSLPPDGFPLKTGLIWMAIIGAVVALFLLNPPKAAQPAKLNIQRVVELADQGKVANGTIRSDATGGRDWSELTGETNEAILPSPTGGATKSFTATGRLTDNNLELLQKSKVFVEKPATTAMTQLLYNVLPFVVVIGLLYFLFVRQLKSAGKGALSFGKSRAKMLTRDKDRVTFGDVAGCDEAKEEVGEVVEFLRDPKEIPEDRRPHPEGHPDGRSPGHRQDAARQGHCRRGGRAVSSPSAVPISWKCSSASARVASATCSNRAARTLPA